jgi:hypothetical protein
MGALATTLFGIPTELIRAEKPQSKSRLHVPGRLIVCLIIGWS